MFGSYEFPLKIDQEGVSISVEKEGDLFLYRRVCQDREIQKILAAGTGKILINPIEPLRTPKDLSTSLLIAFERPVLVEPRATRSIFLKFPTEIGVYISTDGDFELLDAFALEKQKFTLYGDPGNGVICKYWKSDVYPSIPEADPFREGVVDLEITNAAGLWSRVSRAVFNAYAMKIYYSDKMVAMKATMKIRTGDMAETDFMDSPLEPGMDKSLECYVARKLSVVSTKFVMEHGL